MHLRPAWNTKHGRLGRGPRVAILVVTTVLLGFGCDAFNPAFVNLVVDPTTAASFTSITNAPGHVVIQVVNAANVDESLVNYLTSLGVTLTANEQLNLHPRIRLRLRVTFTDGTFLTLEFITGSEGYVDPAKKQQAEADLNQNTFDNAVVLCDVASVTLEPSSNIEVFVPVDMTMYELVTVNATGDVASQTAFQSRGTDAFGFRPLQVDQTDADGNVTLQRNIGVRDVLAPINNVTCGSVIGLTITGTLSVPFFRPVDNTPSYDINDAQTIARIGGRFEFRLTAN